MMPGPAALIIVLVCVMGIWNEYVFMPIAISTVDIDLYARSSCVEFEVVFFVVVYVISLIYLGDSDT